MDCGTYYVHYVQESQCPKPFSFLGICPVTEDDRVRVLGAKCGSPRYPASLARAWDDAADDEEGDDSISGEAWLDEELALSSEPSAPASTRSQLLLTFATSSESLPSCVDEAAGARKEVLGAKCASPRRQPLVVLPEVARTPSEAFAAEREAILGSRCGTPRGTVRPSSRDTRRCRSFKDAASDSEVI